MKKIENKFFSRTENLLGEKNYNKLFNSKVLILGLGGVGGICLEMLVRSGINNFILVDNDKFESSNLNRQILSTINVLGKDKVLVAKKRIKLINPNIKVKIYKEFVNKDNIENFVNFGKKKIDFVVDTIDSVQEKLEIIKFLYFNKINFISSMGAGFVKDIFSIKIADISETNYCCLAKYIRKNLKKSEIEKGIKCVFSDEKNRIINKNHFSSINSISTIINTFGIILADYVIKELIK